MKSSTMISFLVALICGIASGQTPRGKPKELDQLKQYVGHWTTEVTSKQAEWTPQELEYRCSNHAEFASNGWFLEHREVNHIVGAPDKLGKGLWFQTYDPASSKYITWFFQSSGIISHTTGVWDAASKSFHFVEVEPPQGTTHRFTERFRDAGSIDGTLAFTGLDGRQKFEMVWTRKRQAGLAGKQLMEQWGKLGTPIEPIPDDVKKLEPFVGTKDVEFIHRPSITSPQGNTTKTVTTGEWILDGRFVLARTGAGEKQSFFVSGYDTNKKAFRYVRFGFNGEVEENIGQWNAAARSFEWKGVGDATGLTRTSTSHLLDNGAVETHILTKTPEGKVHMDLTIKSTPRR